MERVRLIALDMDGTLLASDHKTVPQKNIEAIRRADAAGVRVCICTGRMIEDASDFIKRLDIPCMIIACNGTRASDGPLPEGRMLLRRALDPKDAKTALDILLPYRMMINGFEDGLVTTVAFAPGQRYHLTDRGLVEARYGAEAMYEAAERGIMKFYVAEDGYAGATASPRVEEARSRVRAALPHLQITHSGPGNIEIMPPDANKGTALEQVAGLMGLTRENVMAVGDAQNDLSMLEYAYHSVAMANAEEEILRTCRYKTLSNDDCGVAAIIDRVLEAQNRLKEA